MTARSLAVGLDGADADVIRALGPGELPVLHGLMRRGAWARLKSVLPPATLPNWLTFLTGLDPGEHGVFDFTTRHGYGVEFTGGTAREAPTLAARLDALGLACACIGFPGTWPPERLRHGVFVSGWDSPVAFEADRSFVWPPQLYDDIVRRFGPHRFDDVDEPNAGTPGWHDALPAALVRRVERTVTLAEWLIRGRAWDLFAVYFGESDTAAHHLWSLYDAASPRRPGDARAPLASGMASGMASVYRALDAAVGRVVEAAGGDCVEVTVVSDHGSGGSSDKVLYLNRYLADAGLLAMRPGSIVGRAAVHAKDAALTKLAPRLRQRVFGVAGRVLPALLESHARFGAIDMKRTLAFSDELNYFPAVHLNIKGREPLGTVHREDEARVRRDVTDALLVLRDPWTHAPVVARVHDREDLYTGPFVHRAPDLVLELNLDAGYSYNVMPSAGAPASAHGVWRKLGPPEHLGQKGRSLPGSHRPYGLYVAAGPSVRPTGMVLAHMADAAATLLARLGVAAPREARGLVLDILAVPDGRARARDMPVVAPAQGHGTGRTERVEARLRALGYID